MMPEVDERGAIDLITAAAKLAVKDYSKKKYQEESFNFLSSIQGILFLYDCDFPRDLKKALEKPRKKGKGNYKEKKPKKAL